MELPSRELISIVLGLEIVGVNKVGNRIEYTTALFPPNTSHINVYELMGMMKEWAKSDEDKLSRKYLISGSYNSPIRTTKNYYCKVNNFLNETEKVFYKGSEFEAVKAACQWKLNETKNN